jgi:hypothetical protein
MAKAQAVTQVMTQVMTKANLDALLAAPLGPNPPPKPRKKCPPLTKGPFESMGMELPTHPTLAKDETARDLAT